MTDMPMLAIPLKTDDKGVMRVAGTRIPIDTVIACYHQGDTPESIHEGFSTLSIPVIYAVIAYYLEHRAEIDAYIHKREEEAEQMRQEIEANYPPHIKAHQEKLRALKRQRDQTE